MRSRIKGPHVRDQHFAEGDDFVKPTPRYTRVRKVTNDSSGKKSAELTSLQSTIPRRPRGRPAKKCRSAEKGFSKVKTCTAKKKPSMGKDHTAYESHAARKYYVVVGDPLDKTILIEEDSSDDEECPTTGKRSSAQKNKLKEKLSVKRPSFSEKSCSVKKHPSAEKDIPMQRGCLIKKRCLTGKDRSTKEDGLSERDSNSKRCRPIERGQSPKKGLSTKKGPSLGKGYLDRRGHSRESHHPEEKNSSAKKLSCTERGRSMKRGLSTEEDHPVGRGRPAKKSHLAESHSSANKSRSAGRGCPIKSRPADKGRSVECIKLASSKPFAGEAVPTGRGRRIQNRPAEAGPLVEWSNTVEKRPSTGKDHPNWRSRPQKKSHPADESQSADRESSAGKHRPTCRGRPPKKSCYAEKHLSAERGCPPKKSRPAEKALSSKRICSAEKVHSGEGGHIAKKKRQLSAKKGSMAKICSGESAEFQDSCSKESNTMEVCSVEKGHQSMEKDFPVEKPSSGSMPNTPVPKHTKNTPESRIDSGSSKGPQVPHQNVAEAVTTGQRMQSANTRTGTELKLPKELKACLLQDWKLINRQKQLFKLPAEKSVDRILASYVTFVKSQQKCDDMEYSVDELVYGIREYFNKMLGAHLLYQFEKPQYAGVMLASPKTPMSQIYGAPHLLRLFLNIGTIFAKSSLNRQNLTLVSRYMGGFLDYLAKNSTYFFSASNYTSACAMNSCKILSGSHGHSVMP